MEALRLVLALLLPWLTTTLALRRARLVAQPTFEWGLGYLLGLLLTTLLLRLAYALELPPFASVVGLWGVLLLTVVCLPPRTPAPRMAPISGRSLKSLLPRRPADLWLFVLLLWALAHLLPTLVEVLVRPVYPWDAWTTWVYRAKVWFLQGELVPFLPPGVEPPRPGYELEAWSYPPAVSLIHLWPALALGHWSETLVNLPGWLAGPAVALGLHGIAREGGFPPLQATLMACLFLSIPLVDVHMALPGYADLWMSGLAGLGLGLVLMGRRPRRLLTGLALLACALLLKREAIAWLAAGALFLALRHAPRATLLGLAGAVGIGLLWWLSGAHWPGVGRLHLDGEWLHLGKLGTWPLHLHNVLPAFWRAFFLQGSWHLTWLAVGLALVTGLLRLPTRRLSKAPPAHPSAGATRPSTLPDDEVLGGVLLILLVALVLFTIFFLSPESRWAADLTAINRLPLQVLPALILACASIWRHAPTAQRGAS